MGIFGPPKFTINFVVHDPPDNFMNRVWLSRFLNARSDIINDFLVPWKDRVNNLGRNMNYFLPRLPIVESFIIYP